MIVTLISVILIFISLFFRENKNFKGGHKIIDEFDPTKFVENADTIKILKKSRLIRCKSANYKEWIKKFDPTLDVEFSQPEMIFNTEPINPYLVKWNATPKLLLGTTSFLMTPFLRKWQYDNLLQYITHRSTIFDIGIGTGRSSKIWREKQLKVFGVEPSTDNYHELIRRHKYVNAKNIGGQDPEIQRWIPAKSIDIVMMSYSITFFFESEEVYLRLIDNIEWVLKPGGKLIIVGMDGDIVHNWFGKSNILDNDLFTLKKMYQDRKDFGNLINLTIKNPVTLVTDQNEYLTKFDKIKFKKIFDEYAKPPYYLAEWPSKFVSAQRMLIFEK